MSTTNSNEGAGIKCCVCGARPYPELSLPEVVPQTYDLMKIRGRWRCSQHHKTKVEGDDGDDAPKKAPSPRLAEIDRVENVIGRLHGFLSKYTLDENADGEADAVADSMLDEIKFSLARLRKTAA
jgi:hypothetical protein